ncbi:MAG: hypothetical protein M3Y86_08235, partial [Verrucomicrobiota bacterium]|nr:hypothetical protein [Verrucomicrobiota bacterium]
MKRRWKKIRYRLEWLALMAALKVVPLLSRKVCYQLGGLAGRIAASVDRQGRRVALSNLEAAFGASLSPTERERIARESYEHFARTMLDLFWSPRLTSSNFRDYIELENIPRLLEEIGPARSCIFGVFHYGNFEWLSLAYGWLGLTCA